MPVIRSMTGFGSATGNSGDVQFSVEVRTVNHRFFNPSIKLPALLNGIESEIKERLRGRIHRGHTTLVIRLERDNRSGQAVNGEAFAAAHAQLEELRLRHTLPPVCIADILRVPGVLAGDTNDSSEWSSVDLLALVDRALDDLDQMRTAEGERLRTVLLDRLLVLSPSLDRVAERAPARLAEQHARLKTAVAKLLEGTPFEEQRVAHEIATLTDKLDIQEEITRMRSHITAFRDALTRDDGEAAGKRLGFILQEMLREVNTIGSKGADVPILTEVLLMKEELERLREQCENLE